MYIIINHRQIEWFGLEETFQRAALRNARSVGKGTPVCEVPYSGQKATLHFNTWIQALFERRRDYRQLKMEILGEIYSFSFNFPEILKKNLIILQSQACDTLQLRKTKLSQHIPFQASESEDFDLLP